MTEVKYEPSYPEKSSMFLSTTVRLALFHLCHIWWTVRRGTPSGNAATAYDFISSICIAMEDP